MSAKSAIVAINPVAGQGKSAAAAKAVEAAFAREGMACELVSSNGPGDVRRIAAEAARAGVDLFVAAGGDGTVNEAANGLAGSDVALGVLPLGTGNVLARHIGLPIGDIEAAIRALATGVPTRVDMARAGGRYFLLMAGFGFDATVVRHVIPEIKDRLGIAAYAPALMTALFAHKTTNVRLDVDGETFSVQASMIVVANAPTYGMNIRMAPRASMSDGLLDVCIFERDFPERLAMLTQVLKVLTCKAESDRNISYFTAKRVRVEGDPPILAQIDGDLAGQTPMEVEVVPGALTLIVPSGA